MVNRKIVCLGGGIGTANLVRGIKKYFNDITVVVSMADDGGSAGRLRRFYKTFPPGDLINCIMALSSAEPIMLELLKYRFAGNRYGSDVSLPGQKLGNLILVALAQIKEDFGRGLLEMQRIFKVKGNIYPSTAVPISIWAKTSTGHTVTREENIDLGKFKGQIIKLFLRPKNPSVSREVIDSIENADIIIAGPGDLYTTVLPVLMVPSILEALKKTSAKKIFVVNVANKPFETPKYTIEDFAQAIKKHCQSVIFDTFFLNNNFKPAIPSKYKTQYKYVPIPDTNKKYPFRVVHGDLISEDFSLYHDSKKLAKTIVENL
ncbi:MAG: YvcK family protein [Patescibacteria group bacterium]|nr:YvcK family protein [Patescibacteria group bacterium]